MSQTDYEYDVFLSYLHERPCGPWVIDHLLPYFRHQLGNALNRPATIFLDRTGIHLGQRWPNRLKEALATSRCLVGIWSPLYFRSQWCLNECEIMRHRETQLGLGNSNGAEGLIVGIKVNDGIYFPPFARSIHWADFEPYFVDGPAFNLCPLHVQFQKEIVPLAQDVARIVSNAPRWSAEWLTPAWTDNVIAGLQQGPPPVVSQPILA